MPMCPGRLPGTLTKPLLGGICPQLSSPGKPAHAVCVHSQPHPPPRCSGDRLLMQSTEGRSSGNSKAAVSSGEETRRPGPRGHRCCSVRGHLSQGRALHTTH